MLRDIRELTGDPEAYAAELRRRWGGLLSYRYIGRFHASMDNGPADETVTLRRDMRNPTGGLLLAVLGIASPDSGGVSDLEAVPNPVIHSCQILDPGRDVTPHRGQHRGAQAGTADGLQPLDHRRRRQADAGAGTHRRAGRQHRRPARRVAEDGARPARGRRLRRPAAAVAGVRRRVSARRPLGTARTVGRGGFAGRRAAHRAAVRHPGDRGAGRRGRRDRAPTNSRACRRT